MIAICIVLSIITIICITLLFLLNNDIKRLIQQIEYKNKSGSHFDVSVQSDLPAIKDLQRKINELYSKTEKTEEVSQHKEKEMQTLISGISHDMRTPLTSMQGYLDLLKDTKSEEERKKYIEIIEYRLSSLKIMLEDLFTHAKLNDDQFVVEFEEISLYPILCKVLASFYYDFSEKQIEPKISFENEQLKVRGNEELFSRIVQNLISNALIHGINTFEILQKESQIIFSNTVKNREVDVEKLFDRFYKAEPSRHQISSGLGLANVKEMVNTMGWSVWARLDEDCLSIVLELDVKKSLQ